MPLTLPRGIVAVYAMARPRRPAVERDLVRQAAGRAGGAAERAVRLARRVAAATMLEMDAEETDRVLQLLRAIAADPMTRLASDPEIDTAALIRSEREKRAAGRGGRRLRERDWPAEDREILAAVSDTLSRRYRAMLAG